MKKLIFILLFITATGYAQNKQILYDFAGLPQTLLVNPGAEVSNKLYVGFPLFSQFSVQGGFTAFSAYDIFADNGVDINTKISNAIQGFGKTEFTEVNQQLEVFSGGFQLNENNYLSFGYYQEFSFLAKIPRDVIDLVYEGNTEINRTYSINKLGARGELLGVFHAGISKKINEKWQVGARAKLYSSAFNLNSKNGKGNLKTTYGTNNVYEQSLNNIDFLLQTSGLFFEDTSELTPSYYIKKLLLGGNLGLGVDVGFTHHFEKQWTVSASLLDFGFVYNTQNIESYSLNGDFVVDGFDLNFDNQDPADYWNNLEDRFNEEVVLDSIYSKYISTRPLKLNGAIHYAFGKKLDNCRFDMRPGLYSNKVGFQLFSTVGSVHSYMAATVFFERWFSKHFQAKATYTVDPYSFYNLGIGVSSQIGPVNLYVLADNLLYLNNLYNAKSANVQIGLNFIIYNKY
jgi:hypothetical protein